MASTEDSPAWIARYLLRATRSATLASSASGQPFASLVTHACTPDLSLLLFLSDLSEHTRHLRADPRCSLLVCGPPTEANPQTAPRVTVTGLAESADDPALKARYLALHPYAALYAGFADFNIWRIKPLNALFVGGFARAVRLRSADLAPNPDAVADVAAAESGIIAHCNTDHPAALTAIARQPGNWRMVVADVDGCDLAWGDRVVRTHWAAPIASAGDVRSELVGLARQARA
ncbi:MAG: pyridoxamine 5'-phosphate oxidase family protein [Rhodospirillales bacterium]